MVLVKLQDVNIIEISDTLEKYHVFQGTFSDDSQESAYGVTLYLDDDRIVKMESFCEPYGSPEGFDSPSKLIVGMLELVSSGASQDMLLKDFVHWLSNFASAFKLSVVDAQGVKHKLGEVRSRHWTKTTLYDLLEGTGYDL